MSILLGIINNCVALKVGIKFLFIFIFTHENFHQKLPELHQKTLLNLVPALRNFHIILNLLIKVFFWAGVPFKTLNTSWIFVGVCLQFYSSS